METNLFTRHIFIAPLLISWCIGCSCLSSGCKGSPKTENSQGSMGIMHAAKLYRPENYDPRFEGFMGGGAWDIDVGKDVSDFLVVLDKGQVLVVRSEAKVLDVWQRTPPDFDAAQTGPWIKIKSIELNEKPSKVFIANKSCYVMLPEKRQMVRVDLSSGKINAELSLPEGPYEVASWLSFSHAAVACHQSKEIIVIDVDKMAISSRQKLEHSPRLLAAHERPGIVYVGYSDQQFISRMKFNDRGKIPTFAEKAYNIFTKYRSIQSYAGCLYVVPSGKQFFFVIPDRGNVGVTKIRNLGFHERFDYFIMGPCGDHGVVIFHSKGNIRGTPPHLRNRSFVSFLNLITGDLVTPEYVKNPMHNIKVISSKQSFNGEMYFVFDKDSGLLHVFTAFDEFE